MITLVSTVAYRQPQRNGKVDSEIGSSGYSVDFGGSDSFPYDRARARDYHPAGRDNATPGHQGHRNAYRAEPGPPLEQYREAHPDNHGDDNSVDNDPGEASEQVVFPTSTTVAHEQHWSERPEDPHRDE